MERGIVNAMQISFVNASGRSTSRLGIAPRNREYAGYRQRVNRRAAATAFRAAWSRLARVPAASQGTIEGTTLRESDYARRTDAVPGFADAVAGALLYGVLVLLVAALA